MTARAHRITRSPRAGDPTPDALAVAQAEVDEARAGVTVLRRLASERRVGASEVSLAEYRYHKALERMAQLDGLEPGDAA